ncbi:hypothetical protein Tco_1169376 [Tanacetum coccineum]
MLDPGRERISFFTRPRLGEIIFVGNLVMDKSWMYNTRRSTRSFVSGVETFQDFEFERSSNSEGKIFIARRKRLCMISTEAENEQQHNEAQSQSNEHSTNETNDANSSQMDTETNEHPDNQNELGGPPKKVRGPTQKNELWNDQFGLHCEDWRKVDKEKKEDMFNCEDSWGVKRLRVLTMLATFDEDTIKLVVFRCLLWY